MKKILSICLTLTLSLTQIVHPAFANPNSPNIVASFPETPYTDFLMKGLMVNPENPLQFDFIFNHKNKNLDLSQDLENDALRQIRYFLASLAIPEQDLWVNLSPYEPDRIIPKNLARTDMGRDMLAQDYILKQMTAFLMSPENELGKEFWNKIQTKAYETFGVTDIEEDSLTKVWIVPGKSKVFENGVNAYVLDSDFKVMLEEDYFAKQIENGTQALLTGKEAAIQKPISEFQKNIIQQVIIPELEYRVNHGREFSSLRKIYSTLVLATWFKKKLNKSLLGQIYVDQEKLEGIELEDTEEYKRIYKEYVSAFESGVFEAIKEDYDPVSNQIVPKKYFTGGVLLTAPESDTAQLGDEEVEGVFGDLASLGEHYLFPIQMKGSSEVDAATLLRKFLGIIAIVISFWAMTEMFMGMSPLELWESYKVYNEFVEEDFNEEENNNVSELQSPMISWLLENIFDDGMPRSFQSPASWEDISLTGKNKNEIIERTIIERGLSLYDGAAWVIALIASGEETDLLVTDIYTNTLVSGRWRKMDMKAWKDPFKYQGKKLPYENALFFRTLSSQWEQPDPLDGSTTFSGFNVADYDPELLVWADWKPITGENAWIVMSQIQKAYVKYKKNIPVDAPELKIVENLFPAFQAMQLPTGAVLHAPTGTADKKDDEVSNENLISLHAAMNMTYEATGDSKYKEMADGLEEHLKKYGFNPETGLFAQGGRWSGTKFIPNFDSDMAVDVQTWMLLSPYIGPKKVDEWFGEGTAYKMWVNTKTRAGFRQDGVLYGVGYTDGDDIFSGEWTEGAVGATLELALYYKDSHPDWAKEMEDDAISMTIGLETLAVADENGKAYYYANKSYPIPFGWNARRLLSTASTAWAFFIQTGYNPFKLGGKTRWHELRRFQDVIAKIRKGEVPAQPVKDNAVLTDVKNGGIDFRLESHEFEIIETDLGIEFNIDPAMIQDIQFDGLAPVPVAPLKPVLNLPKIFGMGTEQTKEFAAL